MDDKSIKNNQESNLESHQEDDRTVIKGRARPQKPAGSSEQSSQKPRPKKSRPPQGKPKAETPKKPVSQNPVAQSLANKKPKSSAAKTPSSDPKRSSVTPSVKPSAKNPGKPLTSEKRRALTEIDLNLQSGHSQQGFIEAKQDADKALADNQIILKSRFVLKETLGCGGMGTVYKSQDLRKVEARDINPYVAVKVLNSDFRDHPEAFISLQREASRSHRLSHPNIVTVHDFDRDGDTIFMTMELLEGKDLESLISEIKNRGLPKEEALTILKDLFLALDFAHKKRIIHSDLKPGNIFVTKNEGTKVLDFGIARLALESKKDDHFDAGVLCALTPAYASLEMLEFDEPDPRDDVFAAALIAYELLAGKHPYDSKPADEALEQDLEPERISSLTNRQWRALQKGLELRREDRSESIHELMDGLIFKPQFPLFKAASVVLLSVVTWIFYNQFFAPNELNEVIEDTMAKARQCFEEQQYQCTLESVSAVLEIAPKNDEAIALGKEANIKRLANIVEKCIARADVADCHGDEFRQLERLIPNSEQFKTLSTLIKQKKVQSEVDRLLNIARVCFQNSDFPCAQKNAADAADLQLDNIEAIQLLADSTKGLKNAALKIANDEKLFNELFSKAQNCFKRKNFSCAEKEAKEAMALNVDTTKAEELYQNATYAYKQQQDNLRRAKKILNDGYLCLKKLDYSCAIAKSESALEFVPGYTKALKLKKEATDSLTKVKNNIRIE